MGKDEDSDNKSVKSPAPTDAAQPSTAADVPVATETAGTPRSLSEVEAALAKQGFTRARQREWLEALRLFSPGITDEEIAAIVRPDPQPPRRTLALAFMRELRLLRHEVWRWLHHESLIARGFYATAWVVLLSMGVLKAGWSIATVLAAVAVCAAKFRFIMRDIHPKHMQQFRRTYLTRKLMSHRLLEAQQSWTQKPPNEREVREAQREALELITIFIRDHRADLKGKEIFASLLVREGSMVEVIGRSDRSRPVPTRYAQHECTLAWKAIATGIAQKTGDIYREHPSTGPGKRYNSVLVLPVMLSGETLGAVSIDSEAKYHFERCFEELQTYLAPYVQLLAPTLALRRDTVRDALTSPPGEDR